MPSRAEFVSLVALALARDEIPDAVMASWLRKAAKRINEELRVGEMLKHKVLPVSGTSFVLPTDFIRARDVRLGADTGVQIALGSSKGALVYCTPAAMATMQANRPAPGSAPGYYTVNGRQMDLSPFGAGQTYQIALWYFAAFPDLGADASATNALTEQFEDLFLNAVLIFGHRHYFEDDRALLKDGLVQQEIARLNLAFEEAKYGDGPLVMQPSRKMGGRFS